MQKDSNKIDRRKFIDKSVKVAALASLPFTSLGAKTLKDITENRTIKIWQNSSCDGWYWNTRNIYVGNRIIETVP